jgi:hypothetical protein
VPEISSASPLPRFNYNSNLLQQSLLGNDEQSEYLEEPNQRNRAITFRDSIVEQDDAIKFEPNDDLLMIGYATTSLGTFCFYSLAGISLLWLGIVILIIYGYYDGCELTGIDNFCFYGEYQVFGAYKQNSEALFGAWCFGAIWFPIVVVFADDLKTLCMMPTIFRNASHVWVWAEEEEDQSALAPSSSYVIQTIRSLRARFVTSKHGHSELVPVRFCAIEEETNTLSSSTVVTYIEFQCTRYVFRGGQFTKAAIEISATNLTMARNNPLHPHAETGPGGVGVGINTNAKWNNKTQSTSVAELAGLSFSGQVHTALLSSIPVLDAYAPFPPTLSLARSLRPLSLSPHPLRAHCTYDRSQEGNGMGPIGLTSSEATSRLHYLGPNTIPFKVDDWGTLLNKEFFTAFYVYQLLVYTVWFWYSYLVVATFMSITVMVSAAANIFIARTNQKTIAAMTVYSTNVGVRRDMRWLTLDSAEIVPGDVCTIRSTQTQTKPLPRNMNAGSPARSSPPSSPSSSVSFAADVGGGERAHLGDDAEEEVGCGGDASQENEGASSRGWVLPCDMLLLSGSCVVDESGLTGESMPVQKVQVPVQMPVPQHGSRKGVAASAAAGNDATKKKKHLLFAGTTVLQVQGGADGTGVPVGVVLSTGINTDKGQLIAQILFPTQMRFKYDEELPAVCLLLLLYAMVAFVLSVYFQVMAYPVHTLTHSLSLSFSLSHTHTLLPPLSLPSSSAVSERCLHHVDYRMDLRHLHHLANPLALAARRPRGRPDTVRPTA